MRRPFCLPPLYGIKKDAVAAFLRSRCRRYTHAQMDPMTLPPSPLSSNESDPSWRKPAAASAVAARSRLTAARASAAAAARVAMRRFRQQPYARPSHQRGVRLRTPSDDEDEIVGPAKVEEG
jgi:hypothetical protein